MSRDVVLDTNVFIAAAFKPGSDSARVLEAVRSGRLRLVWSEATRNEAEALLEKIPPISWETVADLFEEGNRWPELLDDSEFSTVPDPDDRKFAALAAASGATLVSLDSHLLDAGLEERCAVRTPSAFLGPE